MELDNRFNKLDVLRRKLGMTNIGFTEVLGSARRMNEDERALHRFIVSPLRVFYKTCGSPWLR